MELDDSAISEYTYERTLLMEQRNEMLKEMRVSEKRKGKMVSFSILFYSFLQGIPTSLGYPKLTFWCSEKFASEASYVYKILTK